MVLTITSSQALHNTAFSLPLNKVIAAELGVHHSDHVSLVLMTPVLA
jgi:hypothetical protein